MDWKRAIEINHAALVPIIATLLVMARVAGNASPAYLPRSIHGAVLQLLRPAESAVRRLIFMMHRLAAKKPSAATRAVSSGLPDFAQIQGGASVPAFQLYDPRKKFNLDDNARPSNAAPKGRPPSIVHAKAITLRLRALQAALTDLPKQAKRLARAEARRATLPAGPKCVPPFRPGLPPGYKRKPSHAVHELLKEVHLLSGDLTRAPP